MSFSLRTFIFLLTLTSNSLISQVDNCYFEDTSSLIAVIESPVQGKYEWYTEAVYIRIPENFLYETEHNIVDFILKNSNNEFIVNNYKGSDSTKLISIYDILPLESAKARNSVKISLYKLKSLYIKSIPGVQFTFGDSIKYKHFTINLEEVFVTKNEKPEKLDELKMPYIRDNITFEQIDFWEYVRDRRYIRRSYQCE